MKTCRLYNVFRSDATHDIHAQFISQSALANRGKMVGVLRGTSTRFATWFYAMMRLLRLKDPLRATITQVKFQQLDLNDRARSALIDIMDDIFWRALFCLSRAVFPSVRVLRYYDSNIPAMEKLYHLARRTSKAIEKSVVDLNNTELFGPLLLRDGLQMEENDMYGETMGAVDT